MSSPKEIVEAAEGALRIVDKLVAYAKDLQWLFAKAVSLPRRALLDLEGIITEIGKSVTAIDSATKVFFDAIENPSQFIDDNNILHEMSGPRLSNLVEEKRTHCHDIQNIYDRYLNGAISNLFQDAADRDKVRDILLQLGNADVDLFRELTLAADKMRDVAKQAYELKLTGKKPEAVELIKGAALGLLEMRNKLGDSDIAMRKISGELVKAARVAPV